MLLLKVHESRRRRRSAVVTMLACTFPTWFVLKVRVDIANQEEPLHNTPLATGCALCALLLFTNPGLAELPDHLPPKSNSSLNSYDSTNKSPRLLLRCSEQPKPRKSTRRHFFSSSASSTAPRSDSLSQSKTSSSSHDSNYHHRCRHHHHCRSLPTS